MPRQAIAASGHVDVADPEIIQKRRSLGLLNHVPFHFFAKTPFAWSAMNSRPGEPFVYISLKRDVARQNGYKVLTKHPLSGNLENCGPYAYDQGFEQINWAHMDWREFRDDDCKATCLAECLAPGPVTPSAFHCVYVRDDDSRVEVLRLKELRCSGTTFFVSINAGMFNHD